MSLTRLFSTAAMTVLCVFALSVVSKADTVTFTAVINSAQEVPTNTSTATGMATLILDTATGKATLSVSFSGLTSGLRDAHIHGPAPVGVNAGVIQGFLTQLTVGSTSGSFSNWALPITLTQQQMTGLTNGLWYVNIHSNNFPGGEIRGQLTAVPEPGTLLLLGAGLLSVASALKKRRGQG